MAQRGEQLLCLRTAASTGEFALHVIDSLCPNTSCQGQALLSAAQVECGAGCRAALPAASIPAGLQRGKQESQESRSGLFPWNSAGSFSAGSLTSLTFRALGEKFPTSDVVAIKVMLLSGLLTRTAFFGTALRGESTGGNFQLLSRGQPRSLRLHGSHPCELRGEMPEPCVSPCAWDLAPGDQCKEKPSW